MTARNAQPQSLFTPSFQKEILKKLDKNMIVLFLSDELKQFSSVDRYYISFVDKKRENLIFDKIEFKNDDHFNEITIATKYSLSSNDINSLAFKEKKVKFLDESNVKSYHEATKRLFELFQIHEAAAVPILKGSESLGVIGLINRNSKILPEEIEKLQKILSDYFDLIKTAWIQSKEKEEEYDFGKRNYLNDKFIQIFQKLNQLSSQKDILKLILKEITSFFGFDVGFALIENKNRLFLKESFSMNPGLDLETLDNLTEYVNEIVEYQVSPPNNSSAELMLRGTHFLFPDVSEVMYLPMAPVDKGALEIIKTPRTAFIFPIFSKNKSFGVIHLYTLRKTVHISQADMKIMATIGELLHGIMDNANLFSIIEEQTIQLSDTIDELKEKEEIINEDLNTARTIHDSLMSSAIEISDDFDISIFYEPHIRVGGDIYLITELENGIRRIFMADAQGHGVNAAFITLLIKSEFDKVRYSTKRPSKILEKLNHLFYHQYSELSSFFACCILDLDIKNNRAIYSSAGHPKQFIYHEEEIREFHIQNSVLGYTDGLSFNDLKLPFHKGDRFFLFTDGLYESFIGNTPDSLQQEQLKSIFTEFNNLSINECVNQVVEKIKMLCQKEQLDDDFTLIGIESL